MRIQIVCFCLNSALDIAIPHYTQNKLLNFIPPYFIVPREQVIDKYRVNELYIMRHGEGDGLHFSFFFLFVFEWNSMPFAFVGLMEADIIKYRKLNMN